MADVKTLSANNVDYSIKDAVARLAIANMSKNVLEHYTELGDVNIEDTLAAKDENQFYEYLFTSNTNTGELVTSAKNHLWTILNIPAANDTSGNIQLAFCNNNTAVWYRRKTWWNTGGTPIAWSSWRPVAFESYSTNETLTGKYWIDGKPIYRKVYKGSVSQSGQVLISASNVDTLVDYNGWYNVNTTYYKGWYSAQGGATWFVATINSNTLNVRFDTTGTAISQIGPVCCVVEYTKTTD